MKTNKQLWWGIIKDDSNRTFEVIGKLSDITHLTDNVVAMMKAGMSIQCSTPVFDGEEERDIMIAGYQRENDLYRRLISEYQLKTKLPLNQW